MSDHGHFHPLGQPPSEHTLAAQRDARAALPFDDERDVEEARRGFVAAPAERRILGEDGTARELCSTEPW